MKVFQNHYKRSGRIDQDSLHYVMNVQNSVEVKQQNQKSFSQLSLPRVHRKGTASVKRKQNSEHLKPSDSWGNTENILLPNVEETWTAVGQLLMSLFAQAK